MPQEKKTGATEPKRNVQVRFRVYPAEDEHLRKAAQDAGFEDKSAYLRAVLLAKHVVVVKGSGVVLVPAAASNEEERQGIADLLVEVLEALAGQEPSQAPGNAASEAPDPAPSRTDEPVVHQQGAEGFGSSEENAPPDDARGAAAPPVVGAPSAPETSPGGGDELVGPNASQEPPVAPADTPPASAAPADGEAAGSIPGSEEAVINAPDPNLGPEVQSGETFETYLQRRTAELKRQGRPTLIAGFEAEAEYRRYAAYFADVNASPSELQQPTPGPVACSRCGTVKRSPGPCPDCGAAA